MTVSVVIPAAGSGSRMGTEKNKQYLTLMGQPILARTIEKFQQVKAVSEIIVVAKKKELDYCRKKIIDQYKFDKVARIVSGGATRQESVYNGLQATSPTANFVLSHDGARPLLKAEMINELVDKVKKTEAVITGVPIKDTVKKVDDNQIAVETPDRSKLVAVQTPQAFERELLLKAYNQAQKDGFIGTDSSSLVERLGKEVEVVYGSYENLKITTPEDLEFAEKILEMRQ